MQDLISRQAAIDAFLTELTKRERTSLLHTWSTVEVKYFIAKILEQLPPAQPGWIPCSERPPEKSEWYLLTAEWDDGLTTVMKDRYVVGEGWTCAVFGAKCLAWQSLPTPYREGRQDDH